MIDSDAFLAALSRFGFSLISGVPCSYLTPLINGSIQSSRVPYINAANEGDAVAIAAGATLGGGRGVAMFQNSGLGNAVSPLTSLTWVFRLPILLIVTWRGQPGGPPDEPQHELMGRITIDQLRLMEIPHADFPKEPEEIDQVLARARQHMDSTGRPFALVMQKDSVRSQVLESTHASKHRDGIIDEADSAAAALAQDEVIETIRAASRKSDVLLATTGFTGRALYAAGDSPNQFYMVGSMGCVSSFGLGLAHCQPNRRIIVIDGDGALLMRLSALPALGLYRPPNLLHIVLNNGVHDSTGGQPSTTSAVNIPGAAVACGYPFAADVGSIDALANAVGDPSEGLRLIHVRTLPRTDRNLPRPNIKPIAVAERLQLFLDAAPCPLA